ncbi:MAG TPA: DUF2232 domain-containing protein, partial [Geobacteraceae bacterium]
MKFPATGSMPDIIKGSVATLALFLAYVALPLVGIVAVLFAPLPAAFYALKSGPRSGVAIVLVSVAVLALTSDLMTAGFYLLQSAVISLSLPLFLLRGVGGARAIVSTVAINLL